MKAYEILLFELDRCEYIVDYEYKGDLEDYTYNGITYSQSENHYFNYLNNLYDDFLSEWNGLSDNDKNTAYEYFIKLLSKRFISDEFFFDVPSIEIIEEMKKDSGVPIKEVKMAYFLYSMSNQQKYYLSLLNNFFNRNYQTNSLQLTSSENSNSLQLTSSKKGNEIADDSSFPKHDNNIYKELYDKYGEFLSTKQLTELFRVSPRTILNWERKGIITNVSEKSYDCTINGHKKRGGKKQYLTSDIANNILLQRKINNL